MNTEILERLRQNDIRLHAESKNFCLFTRNDCTGMVLWEDGVFQNSCQAGISTDKGLGYLIAQDGNYLLEGNTFLEPPSPEQLAKIQQFHADLKVALGIPD